MFCPNENSNKIAQTTFGTFLKNAAIIRTPLLITGFIFVVFIPNRLRKNAQIAAQTVTATDTSAVSVSFFIMSGSLDHAFSVGMKFFAIQITAFGMDTTPSITSHSAMAAEIRKKTSAPRNVNKNVRFLLANTDV
jgi:hypothetical protein